MIKTVARALYRGFLRIQTTHEHHGLKPYPSSASVPPDIVNRYGGRSFQEVDRVATEAGELYRGIGIALGLLGALVVLAALLPYVLNIHGGALKVDLSILKIVLMVLIIALLAYARVGSLKSNWIGTRLYAEQLRYANLARARDAARNGAPQATAQLLLEIRTLLDGDGGQIRYNELRAHHYEAIEARITKMTYWGFALSTIAAVISVLFALYDIHGDWLILFTAFLPVVAAASHGIMGFLRLSEIISQHTKMAAVLTKLRASIPASLDDPEAGAKLVAIAEELWQRLTKGDTAWTHIAEKTVMLPV